MSDSEYRASSSENEYADDDELLAPSRQLARGNASILTAFTVPFEVINAPVHYFNEKFQAGSLKGSVTTLLVSIVGAGTLAVPYAIEQSGLLLGCALFALGGMLASFTLNILTLCAEITGERSYTKIAKVAFGKGFSRFVVLNLCANLYGTTISYMIAAGHTISSDISSFIPNKWYLQQEYVIIFLLMFVITPLGMLKSLSALRYSSLVGMCCILYLTLTVVWKYFALCEDVTTNTNLTSFTPQCMYGDEFLKNKDYSLIASGNLADIFASLPIVIYAYTCHPSLFPILIELKRPNLRRMGKVINRSVSLSLSIYLLLGTFVYLTFAHDLELTKGNFLLNDYRNDFLVRLGSIGMGVSITMTIPLLVATFRNILTPILMRSFDAKSYRKFVSSTKLTKSLLHRDDYGEQKMTIKPEIPFKWHAIVTLLFLFACAAPAILVDDISLVFSFLGATTNPLLGFVFPGMMYLKLSNEVDSPNVKSTAFRVGSYLVVCMVPVTSLLSIYYKTAT